MNLTETKAEKPYYWRVFFVGFGESENSTTDISPLVTHVVISSGVSSVSMTAWDANPRYLLSEQSQAKLIGIAKASMPHLNRRWKIASIFPCGQTNPNTVQPDGKEHEFLVTADVYTAHWAPPEIFTVSVKGPHAFFPAMSEFPDAVKTAAVGKMEAIVIIRCITPL